MRFIWPIFGTQLKIPLALYNLVEKINQPMLFELTLEYSNHAESS